MTYCTLASIKKRIASSNLLTLSLPSPSQSLAGIACEVSFPSATEQVEAVVVWMFGVGCHPLELLYYTTMRVRKSLFSSHEGAVGPLTIVDKCQSSQIAKDQYSAGDRCGRRGVL
jgi:hypothetical protein